MFEAFKKRLRRQCAGLPDGRKGGNNQDYELPDACLSAFGVFFTQSPSFLAYQREMLLRKGQDNAQCLFGVREIPSDNQIRTLLDPIEPACLDEMYWWTFAQLQKKGHLATFRGYAGQWLLALDGAQYFASEAIHCAQCTRHEQGKKVRYSHNAIAPVLVAPGHDCVVSLAPEFMTPQDGADKQDSEAAAARRWLAKHSRRFAPWGVTIVTDDLVSHQPFCLVLHEHDCHYILVCKPESHAFVYEQLDELARLHLFSQCVSTCWNGTGQGQHETWTYRYVNDVWLRDSDDAICANWCELLVTNIESQLGGRVGCAELLYHNSFITDHHLCADNVAAVVRSGCARWKTENENHNTLKHHGYHLEHNFGHGEQHLASFLLSLNLLAFLLHTSLSLTDATYQRIRQALGRRTTFLTTFAPSPATSTSLPGAPSSPSCSPSWNSSNRPDAFPQACISQQPARKQLRLSTDWRHCPLACLPMPTGRILSDCTLCARPPRSLCHSRPDPTSLHFRKPHQQRTPLLRNSPPGRNAVHLPSQTENCCASG